MKQHPAPNVANNRIATVRMESVRQARPGPVPQVADECLSKAYRTNTKSTD